MKNTLILLTLILTFSCNQNTQKNDLEIVCSESTKEDSEYTDVLRIKTCEFNNHLFKSIGKPDLKGRYSYTYEVSQKAETTQIKNSDLFNENGIALEKIINKKLKAEYDSNSKNPEISDCIKWIDFRYYKLNEFGISFTDKNQMKFNMDYGIGSACFNVNSSAVTIEVSELEKYLK